VSSEEDKNLPLHLRVPEVDAQFVSRADFRYPMPEGIDAEHPLELWMPVATLIETLEEHTSRLYTVLTNSRILAEGYEQRAVMDALGQQRDLLEWLKTYPNPEVFIALSVYPTSTEEELDGEGNPL